MAVASSMPKHLCDGRVIERGERAGLALGAHQAIGIRGEGFRQNLDGHVAPELRVARAVDLAHAAGAERTGDLVPAEASAGREGH